MFIGNDKIYNNPIGNDSSSVSNTVQFHIPFQFSLIKFIIISVRFRNLLLKD